MELEEITISDEIKSLIPPLSKEEYSQLEENILSDGCLESLIIWDNAEYSGDCANPPPDGLIHNYILLDGHNRYEICQKHDIDFYTDELEFNDIEEAKVWVINNQLGRRNITDFVRIELLETKREILTKKGKEIRKQNLKQFDTEKPKMGFSEKQYNTQEELAKNAQISKGKLSRGQYVLKHGSEELKQKARNGDISVNHAYRIVKEGISDVQRINLSTNNEWYTPAKYIKSVYEVLGRIDCDPASNEIANQIINAATFYTKENDGLSKEWYGKVFLNPPYGFDGDSNKSNQAVWSERLIDQYKWGIVEEAILLVNAVPGNKWFSPLWEFPICFVDHRIRFLGKNLDSGQPTHSNCFVYLGEQKDKFAEVFSQHGVVAVRYEFSEKS